MIAEKRIAAIRQTKKMAAHEPPFFILFTEIQIKRLQKIFTLFRSRRVDLRRFQLD